MDSETLERELLAHCNVYGLTVTSLAWAVMRRGHFGLSKPRVRQALKTLCRVQRLCELPLFGRRRCFIPVGSRANRGLARSIPEVEKIRRFAMLKICCADGEETLRRCQHDEIRQWFRGAIDATSKPPVSPDTLFYLTRDPAQHLGELIVDFGAAGRWDRVLGRCARRLAKYRRDPRFACRMIKGEFELMIGTATRQKTNRLRNQLAMEPLDPHVSLHVRTVPELLEFISPNPS